MLNFYPLCALLVNLNPWRSFFLSLREEFLARMPSFVAHKKGKQNHCKAESL